MARERRIDVRGHPTCPYCKDEVRPDQPKRACAGCMAWGHAECWAEHGACPACGVATPQEEDSAPTSALAPPRCREPGCDRPRDPAHPAQERCLRHGKELRARLQRVIRGVLAAGGVTLLLLAGVLASAGNAFEGALLAGAALMLVASAVLPVAGPDRLPRLRRRRRPPTPPASDPTKGD